MKKMARICLLILWLTLMVHFASLSVKTFAQSGRVPSLAQPFPTPDPTSAAKSQDEPGSNSMARVDPDADLYRLVFPIHYEGSFIKGRPYHAEPSTNENFIKELNEAGAQGFRIVSIVGGFQVALAKRENVQYDYALFLTKGYLWSKVGFESSYSRLSKQGYHLSADLFDGEFCQDMTPDGSTSYPLCTYTDMFLVERPRGFDEPIREQRLAFTGPSIGQKTEAALNKQVGDRLAEGFYPTFLLSKFEILIERASKIEDDSVTKADIQVVASASRDDLATKVNEKAQLGYRLSMVSNKIALMRRKPANATSTSYVWLDATKKDFETRLAQMAEQGAIYRMTYPGDRGLRNKLIFEQKASGDNTKREYKVLKIEFSNTPDAANQHITTDLKTESKETMKLLNRMAKEGYVVCDLFLEGSASANYEVLLMRSK
jgi:hypothetical protein